MKKQIYFGSITSDQGQILNEPTTPPIPWIIDELEYRPFDVIVDIKQISGGTLNLTIQEMGNDGAFITTANSGPMGKPGKFVLSFHAHPTEQGAHALLGPFPNLGSGVEKQIVSSVSSWPTTVNADVYLVFHES